MNFSLFAIYFSGILTFATPCVFPLIPIYLSMILGVPISEISDGKKKLKMRLFFNTIIFIFGFIVVFVLLGLSATAIGSLLVEYRGHLMIFGGLIIFIFGLKFLGFLKIDILEQEKRFNVSKLLTRFSFFNSFVLGIVFAAGWTPCIGPVLGSIMTYIASNAFEPVKGATYLAVYGFGLATPLVIFSIFTEAAGSLIGKLSKYLLKIERLTGVLLAGVGIVTMIGAINVPSAQKVEISPLPLKDKNELGKVDILLQHGEFTFIEFYSPKCSICLQMVPLISRIEKDCIGKKIKIIKIDVTSSESKAIVSKFRIRGVPTFILLDKKGNEAARLIGYQPYNTLIQAISALIGEECRGVGLLPEELIRNDSSQCGENNSCEPDK